MLTIIALTLVINGCFVLHCGCVHNILYTEFIYKARTEHGVEAF